MNFDFSEEQQMLRDSVARYIQDEYDIAVRRDIVASEEGMSTQAWNMFIELGWLSIPFAEEHGGYGGDIEDIVVVMEELGKGLVVEPFVASILLFGSLLSRSGNPALQQEWIPKLIAGECLGALALHEQQSGYELTDIATTAKADGDMFVLNGSKTVVFNGDKANAFVVVARTSGAQYDRDGLSLLLVESATDGIEKTSYQMMDGHRAAHIGLADVRVPASNLLGELDQGSDLIDAVLPEILIGLSAEALGIMERLNSITTEYARTRKQFGVAIGSFQALQHRMVDTFMAYEQAKSMLYRALCEFKAAGEHATDNIQLRKNLHALKVVMGRAGKLIGEEAIQIHGGIGLTDELNVGHYVKRLMVLNSAFGNADYHQRMMNELEYGAGQAA